jgi:O-antigen ligase
MSLKNKILFVLVLLLFVTFFYGETYLANGIIIGGVVLCGLLYNSLGEKWRLLKERKYIVFQLLFIVMLIISIYRSEDQGRCFRYLDTRLPLLYFPLSIGLIYITRQLKERVLLGMAAVTTLASVFCMGLGIYRSAALHRPDLLYNDSLTEVFSRQSIYVSLLVNTSIFILGYWIFYKPVGANRKALLWVCLLILFATSFFLASRSMMIVLYAVCIGFLVFYLVKKKNYLELTTLVIGLAMGSFLLFKFSPRTLNRFKELAYTQFDYGSMGKESHFNMEITADQWNGANFRLAAWPCGWTLFKREPLLGVGLGDKLTRLYEEYDRRGFRFGVATKKNVHNNYLDTLYSTGIVSFLFFFLGWLLLPLGHAFRHRDWLSMLIIGMIAIAMITEVYFDRTIGGMIVGFFLSFLLADKRKQTQA